MASVGDMPLPTLGVRGGTGTATEAAPPPPPPPPPPPEPEPEPEPEIFEVVEQMPELQGGIAGLQSRIQYPEMARRAGIEGRVFVQFVVDENGSPSNITVVRGIGGGCDEAAVAAVRDSRFTPGLQRGRPVKVRMSLPVTFRLN
jgi:protein TonB